ncbi:helix-turn-helix domain-containing protein [Pannonibacter phragmitetus]|uniref:helix-turn-helix domain-containing protein n=1 Tax=Pannonibacter phragmitetus TaxID=121719 RepID=UPI003D2EBF82
MKLLIALDALLREGSVSAAAASMGLQVSAMSRMLAQLREFYGDPLLERTGQGMRPTPFAEALRLEVRGLANDAEVLLARTPESASPCPGAATMAPAPTPPVRCRSNMLPIRQLRWRRVPARQTGWLANPRRR